MLDYSQGHPQVQSYKNSLGRLGRYDVAAFLASPQPDRAFLAVSSYSQCMGNDTHNGLLLGRGKAALRKTGLIIG